MLSRHSFAPAASQIDWYSFLARPRLPSPSIEALESFRNRSILVTGAGGSIGATLTLRLLSLAPRALILLEASEQALFRLQAELADAPASTPVATILGSVCDKSLLDDLFAQHRPDLVFHAAAHKHVALLEEQPLAAIANNALGTLALAEAAARHSASLILLSTDKAVEPISILGATKQIAEHIILAADGIVVRLGNVLGTAGSVVDTFLDRIAARASLPITHPDAERFFLTSEEAIDLLLAAAVLGSPATSYVPALAGQHLVTSLARFLSEAKAPGQPVEFTITGLRQGDKLREALWSRSETVHPAAIPGLRRLDQPTNPSLAFGLKQLAAAAVERRDLAQTLDAVRTMVPLYHPSATLIRQLREVPTP